MDGIGLGTVRVSPGILSLSLRTGDSLLQLLSTRFLREVLYLVLRFQMALFTFLALAVKDASQAMAIGHPWAGPVFCVGVSCDRQLFEQDHSLFYLAEYAFFDMLVTIEHFLEDCFDKISHVHLMCARVYLLCVFYKVLSSKIRKSCCFDRLGELEI